MAGSKAGGEKRWKDGFAEWVEACTSRHNGRYSYMEERAEDGGRMKARIICPEHGEFLQIPAKHKAGQGCPRCAGNVVDDYHQRLAEAFPDQVFPTDLPASKVPMLLTCPTHGEFKASINQLLATKALSSKYACPQCNREDAGKKRRLGKETVEEWLQRAWPDYSFNVPDDVRTTDKITYSCPKHGEHRSSVGDLLRYHGCPECGAEARAKHVYEAVGTAPWQHHAELQEVHGDNLSFNRSTIYRSHQKVEATCPKHGQFSSMLYSLKAGHGCPSCSSRISKGETEVVKWLKSIGVELTQQCRDTLDKGELDILIAGKALAIEYCGLYWHSERARGRQYHLEKRQRSSAAGLHLITLFEDEWKYRRGAVEATLKSMLGMASDRVFARKTTLRWVPWSEVSQVYEDHHLQGAGTPCADNLVLEHEGRVVAAMSFKGDRFGQNDVELVRYVTTAKVIGGFSKLFKAYTSTLSKGTKIVSYCDYRWFTGSTYKVAGFTQESDSEPGYWWCKGTKRYSRISFQKHKLKDKLKVFDPMKTEEQNMVDNGFWKIWDCGMGKWVYTT